VSPLAALVVDDEWPARNFLVELLRETGSFDGITAVADIEAARAVVERPELAVQVAFIDVRLLDRPGDSSGLDLARWLGGLASPPAVVLATASAQHAVEGFELGALDYLLKPFTQERVSACVARLVERCPWRAPTAAGRRLVARVGHRLVFLDMEGLLAFQAADRVTYLHHVEGVFEVDLSLAALAAALGDRVLRVHRSWLVAPSRVDGLVRQDGELLLQVGPGLRVPVARDRAREVRRHLLAGAVGVAQSD
jgi:DNA-binding LytR/AlgR family response regulator